MARPSTKFSDLPTEWQDWLRRIEKADTKWRRLDTDRERFLDDFVKRTGLTRQSGRRAPEYRPLQDAAEVARIERAEAFLAASEDGVPVYRISKHLGYPSHRNVISAIKSLKGERIDYRKR